jgi:hypothetical protein
LNVRDFSPACVHLIRESVSSRFLRFALLDFGGRRGFSNHKFTTMVKRQKGLTIIQLMVLLLITGIVGSLLLKIIISHRCQSDQSASLCMRHASAAASEIPGWINWQPA